MKRGHQLGPSVYMPTTPQTHDRNFAFYQSLDCKLTQGNDHARQLDLPDKEGFTGFNFIGLWIPVWLGLTSLEAFSMMGEALT